MEWSGMEWFAATVAEGAVAGVGVGVGGVGCMLYAKEIAATWTGACADRFGPECSLVLVIMSDVLLPNKLLDNDDESLLSAKCNLVSRLASQHPASSTQHPASSVQRPGNQAYNSSSSTPTPWSNTRAVKDRRSEGVEYLIRDTPDILYDLPGLPVNSHTYTLLNLSTDHRQTPFAPGRPPQFPRSSRSFVSPCLVIYPPLV